MRERDEVAAETLALYQIDYLQPIEDQAVETVLAALDSVVDQRLQEALKTDRIAYWKDLHTVAVEAAERGGDVRGTINELRPDWRHHALDSYEWPIETLLGQGINLEKHHPFAGIPTFMQFYWDYPLGVWETMDAPLATEAEAAHVISKGLTERLACLDALEFIRSDHTFDYPFELPEKNKIERVRQAQLEHVSDLLRTSERLALLSEGRWAHIWLYAEDDEVQDRMVNLEAYPMAPAVAVAALKAAGDRLCRQHEEYGGGFVRGASSCRTVEPHFGALSTAAVYLEVAQHTAQIFTKRICEQQEWLDQYYLTQSSPRENQETESRKQQLLLHRQARAGLDRVHAEVSTRLLETYAPHADLIMQQIGRVPRRAKARQRKRAAWPEGFEELERVQDMVVKLAQSNDIVLLQPLQEVAEALSAAIAPYDWRDVA